jgi:hypothetical protein
MNAKTRCVKNMMARIATIAVLIPASVFTGGPRCLADDGATQNVDSRAGRNLSKSNLKGETSPRSIVEGVVVPSKIAANEPFTFAATGVVEGEVISIQTVDGEVVQKAKADKHGRIFLAAGLAAGAYQVLAGSSSKPSGMMTVMPSQNPPITANRPITIATGAIPAVNPPTGELPLQIQNMPTAIRVTDPLSLYGTGISPNAVDMKVQVGPGSDDQAIVLAATESEMVAVMPMYLDPHIGPVKVTNTKTAKDWSSDPDVIIYDLRAQLQRQKLANGDRTVMSVAMRPALDGAEVEASILDGPVRFSNGQQTMTMNTRGGQATFPITAEGLGAGKFHVAASLVNPGVWFAPKVNEFGGRSSSAKGHSADTGHGYKGSKKWGPKGKDGKETLRESVDEDYEHGSIRKRTTRRWDEKGRKTEETEEYFDENGKQTGGAKTTWEYKDGSDKSGTPTDKTWDSKSGWK